MEISHDPAKDAASIHKHGISLADASLLDWPAALVWFDVRKEHGEARQVALAVLQDRLYFVAFVDRADGRRVISLRKANQREFDRYVAYIDSSNC